MSSFKKYEYLDQAAWTAAQATIQVTDSEGNVSYDPAVVTAVHEIGNICLATNPETGECTNLSTKWAVDILWVSDAPASFDAATVYPAPVGVHTFAGWESVYAKEYCEKFPDSEYCAVPSPEEPVV
jgi:hypothetical protein